MTATTKLSKYFFATSMQLQNKGMIFSLWICLLFQVNIVRAGQIALTDATGLPEQTVTIKLIVDNGVGGTLPDSTISLDGSIAYDTGILQYIGARAGNDFLAEGVILFSSNENSSGFVDFSLASASATGTQLIVGAELFELDFQILPDSLDGETVVELSKLSFDEVEISGLRDGKIMVVTTPISNIPVPAAIWLFGTSLIGLLVTPKNREKLFS